MNPTIGGRRLAPIVLACAVALALPACGTESTSPGGNQAPSAQGQTVTTGKGVALTIVFAATDGDGDALTFTITQAPANGTLTPLTQTSSTSASGTYTPNAGFAGSDEIRFVASDGMSVSSAAIIGITVENATPTATGATVETVEGAPLQVTLTGDDADDDPLQFSISTPPANGTLSAIVAPALDAGGQATVEATVTYTPTGTFSGADSFGFTVTDGAAVSSEATVQVTVLPETPVANTVSTSTPKNTAVQITLTGSDANGDPLTFAIASNPTNGTLGALTPVNTTSANVTYTPNGGFTGMDEFTFTVNDGDDTSVPAVVAIDVENQAPVANAGPDQAGIQKNQVVTLDGTGSSDPDGDGLTFAWTLADPSQADRSGLLSNETVGQPTFAPDVSGVWTASLTVDDGSGSTSQDDVDITVVNQPPTASNAATGTGVGTPVQVALTGDDPDGDALTFEIVTGPSNGTLGPIVPALQSEGSVASNAHVTYTPNGGFEGSDTFTFTVTDGEDTSAEATATIDVTTGPAAGGVATVTSLEIGQFITLTGSDPFGGGLAFQIATGPTNGTLGPIEQLDATTATVLYTPDLGFQGSDQFTYTVSDGSPISTATSPEATVDITVGGPTEAAIIVAIVNQNSVGVFNSATSTEIAVIDVGLSPVAVRLTPNQQFLYVANAGDNTVSVIETATASVIATLNVGSVPRLLEAHPNGSQVYVGNLGSDDISVIDVATQTVVGTVTITGITSLNDLSVDPLGQFLYATDPSNGVFVFDISSIGAGGGGFEAGGTEVPTQQTIFMVGGSPFEARPVRGRLLFIPRSSPPYPVINGTNGDEALFINPPFGGASPAGTATSGNGEWLFISYGSIGQRVRFREPFTTMPSNCPIQIDGFASGRSTILDDGSIFVGPQANVVQVLDGPGCRPTSQFLNLHTVLPNAGAGDIFTDGFESGDVSAWSSSSPLRRR